MLGVAGARAGLHVVADVQHEPARVLARLHVPQDAARRQPRAARHTRHRQQRKHNDLLSFIDFPRPRVAEEVFGRTATGITTGVLHPSL